MALFHLILSLVTCITNGAFILTVGREPTLRTTTNIILLSMSVADLLVGLCVTPISGFLHLLESSVIDIYQCLGIHAVLVYFALVSVFHIVLVAVERFLSIVYPLRYPLIFTYGRLKLSLAICWTVPLAWAFSPLLGWRTIDSLDLSKWENSSDSEIQMKYGNGSFYSCHYEQMLPCSYAFTIAALVLAVLMTLTYFQTRILWVALRQIRKHKMPSQVSGPNSHHCPAALVAFKKEIRAFFMVMFVVDYFLVSWMPLAGGFFVPCAIPGLTVPNWMWSCFCLLAFCNSAVNPIVYGMAKKDIRYYVMKKLCQQKTRDRRIYVPTSTSVT